jgi:hypothetical protein
MRWERVPNQKLPLELTSSAAALPPKAAAVVTDRRGS